MATLLNTLESLPCTEAVSTTVSVPGDDRMGLGLKGILTWGAAEQVLGAKVPTQGCHGRRRKLVSMSHDW